jgi:hypothetical protein
MSDEKPEDEKLKSRKQTNRKYYETKTKSMTFKCPECNCEVGKYYWKKHQQSKIHQRLAEREKRFQEAKNKLTF